MGDEMDECACFWSQEFALRRLLAMLRQGQAYCTDTECIDLPSLPGTSAQSSDDSNSFTFMSMLLIFGVILYLLRPSSLRRSVQNDNHKTQPPNDGNQDPGSPPIH